MKSFNLNTIKQSFMNKNFKYGGFATLLFLFMLLILVAVNLVSEQLPLKFDLSQNQRFSLSSQTVKLLKGLHRDVTIYALYTPGKEDKSIMEVLYKYRDNSEHVVLKMVDPNKNPGFIKQYNKENKDLNNIRFIITCGNKSKLIEDYDLYNYYTDENTMQQQVVSLAVEQQVSGAILYVSNLKDNPVIYALKGHDESDLPNDVQHQLATENYKLQDLTLATQNFPEGKGVLLITAPNRDLTGEEVAKIRSFLANKGRALFLIDYTYAELPNLKNLLNSYGIDVQRQIVVEGDQSHHFPNQPVLLMPELNSDSPITKSLVSENIPVLIPVSQTIKTLEMKKQGTTIDPIMTTSAQSWAKVNVNAPSQNKEANDPQGPFHIGVTVTDKPWGATNDTQATKMVVFATSEFVKADLIARFPGNVNLITNSLHWLGDQQQTLSIQAKSLMTYPLRLSGFETILYSLLVVVVIPLAIFITGFVVWMRRKNL